MEELKTWEKFKTKVEQRIKINEVDSINDICINLSLNIAKLVLPFSDKIELKKTEKIDAIGNILYTLATIEYFFKLPSNLYDYLLDEKIPEDALIDTSYPDIIQSLIMFNSNIIYNLYSANRADLQYETNELFSRLFDYCLCFKLNINDCLNESLKIEVSREIQHNKQYENTKNLINKSSRKELLFDIELNEENKYEYLIFLFNEKRYSFNKNNIIIDHFDAINFISENIEENTFSTNYSPKFREYLSLNTDIKSGFIAEEKIINAIEFIKNKNNKTGIVVSNKNYKPCLYTKNMVNLNDLLDYINEHN